MKSLSHFLLLLVSLFYLSGCGGSATSNISNIPEWYTNPPSGPNYLFAPATAVSKDMQLAVDKAVTGGRADIARQTEVKLKGLQKKFDEEVGVGENATLLQQFTEATKTVVSTVLSGSKAEKQQIFENGGSYRAYVLVQYPVGAANEAFLNQVKKKEELYTRYRSSQAYEELEKEVEAYEKYKKEQGMLQ